MVSVEPLKFIHFDALDSEELDYHFQLNVYREADVATPLDDFRLEEQELWSPLDLLELCFVLNWSAAHLSHRLLCGVTESFWNVVSLVEKVSIRL